MGQQADWLGGGAGGRKRQGDSLEPGLLSALATVLALVNFKSRFNKRQKNKDKNPKATTNNETIKEKLKSRTWDGPAVSPPPLGLPTAELDPDRRTDIAYIQLCGLAGRQRRIGGLRE